MPDLTRGDAFVVWRDMISYQDLERYLREVHDILVYYLEVYHSDVIEKFLDEYNDEFIDWCRNETEEGLDGAFDNCDFSGAASRY